MTRRDADKKQSLEVLRNLLKETNTVYTVLRHVSRSGMQRRIDCYIIQDNRPLYLSRHIAEVLNMRIHKNGGIIVDGCGMDMGFHLVYNLSMALYCPEKYDHNAAYTLKHEWL